jgi:protein-S-isoprenylcysteine O-methyltransferase Ste14
MNSDVVQRWVGWAGVVLLAVVLALVFWGMAQAARRPRGRATGWGGRVLRLPFYLVAGVLYFGFCFLIWRPLPLALSPEARTAALALGALLYFPGMGLALWGRLALGRMYNVSSGFGVQLYAGHRLVTHGPFRIVRHPMYLGIIAAALGGLFVYRTWTTLFLAVNFLALLRRARREEQALAAEFGAEWEAYRRRVPGWNPLARWF